MKTTALVRAVLAALFASVVCITTAFLFHIPVGTAGGYIHLGDAFVYLAGAFLPVPYAMAAAGIGSGLADLLTGAPHWAVFTVIIKAAMAACFTCKKPNVVNAHNAIASVGAGLVCVVGYYFAEVLLFGNWITPLTSLLMGGWIQSAAAIVLFLLMGTALDRAKIKTRLMK